MIRTRVWKRESQTLEDWRLLFAVWIAIIIPLLAFGVVYTRSTNWAARTNVGVIQDDPVLANLGTGSAPEAGRTSLLAEGLNPNAIAAAGLNTNADAVAVAPNNPDLVVIAAQRDLLITRDRGRTWIHLANTLPRPARVLVISQTNELTLYADLEDLGLHVSNDGGVTWNPLAAQ